MYKQNMPTEGAGQVFSFMSEERENTQTDSSVLDSDGKITESTSLIK